MRTPLWLTVSEYSSSELSLGYQQGGEVVAVAVVDCEEWEADEDEDEDEDGADERVAVAVDPSVLA
jgi:hypothetical protein